MDDADTIAAIATSAGIGGIGIIRVSGPMASKILTAVAGRALPPRMACHARFTDRAGAPIDEGIGLYFPGPHSYTGEDVCELQGHGGPIVLNALLQRCLDEGARIAQPGEFTKRAFLNGKLDLAQAEAVADLIAAGSVRAARSAVRSLTGEFLQLLDLAGDVSVGTLDHQLISQAGIHILLVGFDQLRNHMREVFAADEGV